MNRKIAGAALAAAVALSWVAGTRADAQAQTGSVVVVHGVEGFLADVYVDQAPTPALSGFEFRRVTDPITLPVGTHRADLRVAGSPLNIPPALSGTFEVMAGQTITIAALLNEAGAPVFLAFPNDVPTAVPATSTSLRFRHFAARGPVTLQVDGVPAIREAKNLDQTNPPPGVVVAPGMHMVSVLSETGAVLLPPQSVEFRGGGAETLYLTGRAANNSIGLLQQRLTAVSSPTVQPTSPKAVLLPAVTLVRTGTNTIPLIEAGLMLICFGTAIQLKRRDDLRWSQRATRP